MLSDKGRLVNAEEGEALGLETHILPPSCTLLDLNTGRNVDEEHGLEMHGLKMSLHRLLSSL